MDPEQFIDAVSGMVDSKIATSMEEFKSELMKIISSKKLGEVSEGRINDACNNVHLKTKEAFDQNMDKFRIYAMRNIFSPGTQSESGVSNGTASTQTDEQLQQLRQRYLSLQAENRALADSCRDAEVLLKDMRSAMFTLKVGAQAFDNGTIENVADMTAMLKHNETALESLIAEANGIVASLTEYRTPAESGEGNGEGMDVVQEISSAAIETKDAEDISALAKSLRRK